MELRRKTPDRIVMNCQSLSVGGFCDDERHPEMLLGREDTVIVCDSSWTLVLSSTTEKDLLGNTEEEVEPTELL